MFFFPRFLLIFYIFGVAIIICFATSSVFGATTLVPNEVETLKKIGNKLGKEWNFSVDPCSGQSGWTTSNPKKGFENNVDCNCTISNDNLCHVTALVLKAQNLPGVLPTELNELPYLQVFDVTRNFLSGTIPREWGSTKLVRISVQVNRLTGSIPKEIGNISTLISFVVDNNQLSGVLPAELGDLPRIERLILTANNFTGELNESFARLTTLQDFRIGGNNFTGKIPDFITKWTNLTRLVIQGSGLDGPIPSDIGLLTKMTDLRISDLNGAESPFPQLDTMTGIETLLLRSCNIYGQIPEYFAQMTSLQYLDLSFNNLSGEIPSEYSRLVGSSNTRYIILTGNLFTGRVPAWTLEGGPYVDLSYNNFTDENVTTCQVGSTNLFGSSLKGNNSGIWCLGGYVCPEMRSYFHINCGGKNITEGGLTYEDDSNGGGPSNFIRSPTNWAFSSTGYFLDDGSDLDQITLTTSSPSVPSRSRLYLDARLSPLSLTYYGFCLTNGDYEVKLHFAEIKFTDDKTYNSLGRRIFDIYIQGVLVLKDFNIENAAGGVYKEFVHSLTVPVTNNTLEIRLYWAGKGTTAIPLRGVFGPLISAISAVGPDSKPAKHGGISAGTVVGIVVSIIAVVVLLGILWWKVCLQREKVEYELRGLDLQTGSFTLRQIKAATNNFDIANKIGEGGFGSVYKGLLSDGTAIAVKQLSAKSKQGNREFVNEIGMISALEHPHLVKLYGCCMEGNQLLLVYEYMENNCLAHALFGPEESQLILDWPTRHKICVGIAKGLAYLHEESRLKIVHRDIKATNVLLDKDLNSKISDFGLAKLNEEDNTHIITRIAGTFGYMAPEYAMRGYLTDKADVYSFGIVALEIVSGSSNTNFKSRLNSFYLLDWALVLKEMNHLEELIDPKLGNDCNKKEVMSMINVGLLCTNVSPAVRPSMSSVVRMLEGKDIVKEITSDALISYQEMNLQAMKNHYQENQEQSLIRDQIHTDVRMAFSTLPNHGVEQI